MPVIPIERARGRLEVRRGDKLLSQHTIEQRQVLIGRKQQNVICLHGQCVSRHHAVLISQANGLYIVDLKSTNGLYVNAERVRRQALAQIEAGLLQRTRQLAGALVEISDEAGYLNADHYKGLPK